MPNLCDLISGAMLTQENVNERDALYERVLRLERACVAALDFIKNVPTDYQLDARLESGRTGREVWAKLERVIK